MVVEEETRSSRRCYGSLGAWRWMVLYLLRPDVISPLPSSCRHALHSPVHLHPALGSLRDPGVAPACRARPVSLSPVSVMHAAFVVVLVHACNPVACCTCFCRRHVPEEEEVVVVVFTRENRGRSA